MKTILLVLFLTCVGLMAQTPPAPGAPPGPGPGPTSARDERLRQALRQAREAKTNALPAAPAAPAAEAITNQPAAAAIPAPAPGTPAAPPAAATPASPSPATTAAPPAPGSAPLPAPGAAAPVSPAAPVPSIIAPASTNENLVAITPPSPAPGAPPEEMLPAGTINFPATDLNQVLTIYAELVNRTVLRPTTLPAPTITLKTQTPLTRKEAMQAFDAVLALNGIAMIPIGDKFVKAVPVAQAGQEGAAWNKLAADQLPDVGQYITHVVQLKYTKPSEMVQALQPFAKIPNAILPIDASAILVLRDNTENVKRMLEMIKQVDVAVPSEFISEVIPIKYALASDISSALNALSSGGGGATVGSAGAGGTTGARTSVGSRTGYRGTTGGFPGQTTPGMTSPFGTSPMGSTTPGLGGTTGSFTDRLQNIIRRAANVTGEITVLGQTKIIADERTNSLLIFASREDMKMIKDIVSKLDVVLAQVLIEAVIMSVSLDDSTDFGISYLQKRAQGIGNYFTGIGAINNKGAPFLTPGSYTLGGASNAIPGGFSYLGTLGNDLDVSVVAAASGTRTRILQRPRIQTSHAVPATLFVGESRPYPTSSYYGGGAYGGYSSIQQLQIGVTLEVTPLINPDGLVVMDIHQKIDSFQGNVTIQNVGDVPVTSSKDATAKVAVRDRDTIMLGGLIDTQKDHNNSGVPLLKDIPLLGYLFRSSHDGTKRNELIVLIRPTVLPTPEVAALGAANEKNKMPEVRKMEAEIEKDEARRLKSAEQELKELKKSK